MGIQAMDYLLRGKLMCVIALVFWSGNASAFPASELVERSAAIDGMDRLTAEDVADIDQLIHKGELGDLARDYSIEPRLVLPWCPGIRATATASTSDSSVVLENHVLLQRISDWCFNQGPSEIVSLGGWYFAKRDVMTIRLRRIRGDGWCDYFYSSGPMPIDDTRSILTALHNSEIEGAADYASRSVDKVWCLGNPTFFESFGDHKDPVDHKIFQLELLRPEDDHGLLVDTLYVCLEGAHVVLVESEIIAWDCFNSSE